MTRKQKRLLLPLLLCFALCVHLRAADTPTAIITASLDRGYNDAYNLDFDSAQREFGGWQQQHPGDPVGPVSEAAGLLFSEFHRLGVLETQFFEKDSTFLNRPKLSPDEAVHNRFEAALERAEAQAQTQLQRDPNDHDALFSMTLVYGLRADYVQMIEKRNLAALSDTKQANAWAEKLLAVAPNYYDAYVATGFSKYIIGSLAAPVRWLLRLGGYSGDKKDGMHDLEISAAHGRYLAPFARLLLAIAYLRQHDRAQARQLLDGLRVEFPANPLFPKEIAKLDAQNTCTHC